MLKEIWEWVRSILIAVVLALLFRLFILEHFLVDGQSMYPTLNHSERIIVNKIIYRFQEPQRGDIIVFNYKERRDFIKRVVGMEGDEVEIRDNALFINGVEYFEPYLENIKTADYGPVNVPPEEYFVLGDNRSNSRDSRYPDVGYVTMEKIKGRAFCVFWPMDYARILH